MKSIYFLKQCFLGYKYLMGRNTKINYDAIDQQTKYITHKGDNTKDLLGSANCRHSRTKQISLFHSSIVATCRVTTYNVTIIYRVILYTTQLLLSVPTFSPHQPPKFKIKIFPLYTPHNFKNNLTIFLYSHFSLN